MINLTTIQLTEKQAKQWIIMQLLDSLEVFDIKSGRVVIDFDPQGAIGNVEIVRHFRIK